MKIILFNPHIPANTGNIVRTCHATGSEFILVRPLVSSPNFSHSLLKSWTLCFSRFQELLAGKVFKPF